ncbi:hypothetical protein RDWZM_006645 [Blomia tropicalis]|uniref:RAB6A-GEF complex partner protein 2 n=1 Tax=Blomia tropicalis TaxID=40697 RepID=A0A9Q0M6I4_BLOTA|nr:hypothetical protein RDWZM_006645 [Blomia tropicalis]
MIEIQAKLLRGPIYFGGETIQCLITFQNIPTIQKQSSDNNESSSQSKQSIERLCWANVQLHCFCLVDEKHVNLDQIDGAVRGGLRSITDSWSRRKRSSIALETYASNDTSFHECVVRGEKGLIVYCSQPKILFCDLQLNPGEVQTFVYTENLPLQLNPSYSSARLKYRYKLTIGTQRIGSTIHLLKIPIRILTIERLSSFMKNGESTNGESNNSVINTSSDDFQNDSSPLDLILHQIESLTCHRTPHTFNITNSLGRVAKFYIFKTAYRLGEDVIGLFNFGEGTVPCLKFTVSLQTEEIIADEYRNSSSKSQSPLITTHAKCQEFALNTFHSQMILTIPLTATPTFSNQIVSCEWKLHFRFIINQNGQQSNPILYNETENGVQCVAPRQLNVQTMTWDYPIKVLPTHPSHVAKGFQMASIGTLDI